MNWICNGDELVSFYLPPDPAEHLKNCPVGSPTGCEECFEIWDTLKKVVRTFGGTRGQ